MKFSSIDAAEQYYAGYRPGYYTSKIHGGQMRNHQALHDFVKHKIENKEITIENLHLPNLPKAPGMR